MTIKVHLLPVVTPDDCVCSDVLFQLQNEQPRSSILSCLSTLAHCLLFHVFFLLCTGNIKDCIGNELLKRSRRKLMLLSGDLSRVCSSLTPESSPVTMVPCSHQFFPCQTNDGRVTYPKQKSYWRICFLRWCSLSRSFRAWKKESVTCNYKEFL
jgi:hypothetical protein